MRTRKMLAAVAVAAATAAAAPAGANAAGGAFGVETTHTQDGYTLTQDATGRVLNRGTTENVLQLTCSVRAQPMASAVGMSCYLLGDDGRRFAPPSPGATPGAALTQDVFVVPKQRYRACISSRAFFSDESYMLTAPLACSTY